MPASDTPLIIYQPFNLAVLLTFYSPLIVALTVFSMSFIFQNFKGIIYLLWIIIFSWFRGLFFSANSSSGIPGDLCSMVQYTRYGNSTFSMFFIAFTMVYICGPMILNKETNFWVLAAFLFYLLLDIGVRVRLTKCTKFSYAAFDTVFGVAAGIGALSAMYGAKMYNYVFFNETSSTKDMCSMPTKQTFKCAVYKGGELVGSATA